MRRVGRMPSLLLRVGLAVAVACALAFCSGDAGSGSGGRGLDLTVMTFNIMMDFPKEGFDLWKVRKEPVSQIIRLQDPDIIGFQEPMPWQDSSLQELFPDYGDARLELNTDATIFYRASRFEKLDQGSFWLSPTPDEPWTIGFGNIFPRMVIWVKLRDRESGRDLFVVNTHFDSTNPAQEKSAPLFLERTVPLPAELPTVYTGDFNSEPDSDAYQILVGGSPVRLLDACEIAGRREVIQSPGDPRTYDPTRRIDHIFLAGGHWTADRWVVDMSTYGNSPKDPSDHFAVAAHVHFRGAAK